MFGPLLAVHDVGNVHAVVARSNDSAPFPKVGTRGRILKRICEDALRMAGAVEETCSSKMLGGQGAHFLRQVAFWSMGSSGLLR